MNNTIKLAVASALLAAASSASAGITIPAGDWTVDLGGNVNAFYTSTNYSGAASATQTKNTVQAGLLPSAIGIGAKTRQNDLDTAVQFTFFVGSDSGGQASGGGNSINIRQAYSTFGDASWGSVKFGRDLGIYGSDAILSDMTLLGVGSAAGSNGTSTLGRIGSGYMYADWIGQISYSTPNFNGFQATAGVTQGWSNGTGGDATNNNTGYQGKVTYDFAANDVTGRVWVSGISQKHEAGTTTAAYTSNGFDVGAKASMGGIGIVGYYYDGKGLSGAQGATNGLLFNSGTKSDDKGGYVQATFTVPGVGTKIGASWGESKSQAAGATAEFTNEAWVFGVYHPLTKHLNLVAEYNDQKYGLDSAAQDTKAKTVSLGAILFF
jgi:predicted porin